MVKFQRVITGAARIVGAIIMIQTLYFKFSGAEESVYIFSTIGIEPWGRIGTGVLELIASILLLINATAWMGALLGLGLMSGAMLTHFTVLGIVVQGDGGYLFLLATMVWVCCCIVLVDSRQRIQAYVNRVIKKNK